MQVSYVVMLICGFDTRHAVKTLHTKCTAEAHAALSAVQWQLGQSGSAEEHFATATAIEPRWRDMEFVQLQTRWPPKLYTAMQRFLNIVPS